MTTKPDPRAMMTNQERFDFFSGLVHGDKIICRGEYAEVIRVQHYEPSDTRDMDECPIRKGWFRVRVLTTRGSRWAGVLDDTREGN